jgi:hypothetical protein
VGVANLTAQMLFLLASLLDGRGCVLWALQMSKMALLVMVSFCQSWQEFLPARSLEIHGLCSTETSGGDTAHGMNLLQCDGTVSLS